MNTDIYSEDVKKNIILGLQHKNIRDYENAIPLGDSICLKN
jgi:hypothetical protein